MVSFSLRDLDAIIQEARSCWNVDSKPLHALTQPYEDKKALLCQGQASGSGATQLV